MRSTRSDKRVHAIRLRRGCGAASAAPCVACIAAAPRELYAAQDLNGRTPLHVAASVGSLETCSVIAKHYGERINVVDCNGDTPLDNARMCRHAAIATLLETSGGRSGRDPLLARDAAATQAWVEQEYAKHDAGRRREVLAALPEHCMQLQLEAVNEAVERFIQARSPGRAALLRTPPL